MLASSRFGSCVFVAILLLVLGSGCASLTSTVAEPMRIGNTADLSPAELGLRSGATTLDEARAILRARGLTGIAEDRFVSPSGALVGVLAADYQRRVHVFRDDRYRQSIDLTAASALPYGIVVRLGADRTSTMLLVLVRDPLGRRAQPPQLLAYRWRDDAIDGADDDPYGSDEGRFELASRASLAGLVARHHGMTSPILVGSAFTEGAILFARDARGRVWDEGYLLRSTHGEVALTPMPWATAMRCSCVQKYAMQ